MIRLNKTSEKLRKRESKLFMKLRKSLNKEQKKLLDKYENAWWKWVMYKYVGK